MRIASRNRQLLLHRLLHGDRYKVHGITVSVPPSVDADIRSILARGRPYEAAEATLVMQHVVPGTTVVELGGSIGVIAALLRALIGPDALHVIVEANPHLAAICEANARVGASPGACRVLRRAIDYSGAADVTFSAGNNAHDGHLAAADETGFRVPAITLAQIAATLPPGEFALVCDIEGAEVEMLRHEATTLARVSLVVLEIHPAAALAAGEAPEAAFAQLEAAGFQMLDRIENVAAFRRGAG